MLKIANCNGATKSTVHTIWSIIYSIAKEIYDMIIKTYARKMKFKDILQDSMNDLRGDLYGLMRAKEQGYC